MAINHMSCFCGLAFTPVRRFFSTVGSGFHGQAAPDLYKGLGQTLLLALLEKVGGFHEVLPSSSPQPQKKLLELLNCLHSDCKD